MENKQQNFLYQIRIDAIINQKRWDENDKEFFIIYNWSAELETENKTDVDKLQELSNKSNFASYELPDFVSFHLNTSSEILFDELEDNILKISSFVFNKIAIE